ncbi:hypothetical protein KL938_004117 [Ogataea parapolymorpha]|nr:hypothetical protein KL938_004117 [Ogataea parapolymorpha]
MASGPYLWERLPKPDMANTTFYLLLDGPEDVFGLQADCPETPVTPQDPEVSEEQQRIQKIKEAIQHSHDSPVLKAKMAASRIHSKHLAEFDEDSSLDYVALQRITQLVNMDDDSDSDRLELNKLFPNTVRTIKLLEDDQDNIDRMLRLESSKHSRLTQKVRKRRQPSEESTSLASEVSSDVILSKRGKRKFARYSFTRTESEQKESGDRKNGHADYKERESKDEDKGEETDLAEATNDLIDIDDDGASSASSSQYEPLSQSLEKKCIPI